MEEVLAIGGDGVQAQGAHAAKQAALEHLHLVVRHLDADLGGDELGELVKFGARHLGDFDGRFDGVVQRSEGRSGTHGSGPGKGGAGRGELVGQSGGGLGVERKVTEGEHGFDVEQDDEVLAAAAHAIDQFGAPAQGDAGRGIDGIGVELDDFVDAIGDAADDGAFAVQGDFHDDDAGMDGILDAGRPNFWRRSATGMALPRTFTTPRM